MVMLEEAATWWLGRVIAFIALCVITGMRGNSFSAPTIKRFSDIGFILSNYNNLLNF